MQTRNYSSDGPTKISNKGIFFELEFVEQIPLQGQGKEYIIKMICLIGNASYQIHKKHYIINSGKILYLKKRKYVVIDTIIKTV